MSQKERRLYLIKALMKENPDYNTIGIPEDKSEQKILLRSLFNVRPPIEASSKFLKVQDKYLKKAIQKRGIINLDNVELNQDGIYLYKGDITALSCDAIVNAGNPKMLGCFIPNHKCIDNTIHTYAGLQLRLACNEIMKMRQKELEAGTSIITLAFNLPCKYVVHTTGPVVNKTVTKQNEAALKNCYISALDLARQYDILSIAFPCISTGEYGFPQEEAAKIAFNAVINYLKENKCAIKVVFNVFTDKDYAIYKRLFNSLITSSIKTTSIKDYEKKAPEELKEGLKTLEKDEKDIDNGLKAPPSPAAKKRGRPPKDKTIGKEKVEKAAKNTEPKKPRGRPPKAKVTEEEGKPTIKEGKPPIKEGEKTSTKVAKKRGRPPKAPKVI